METYKQRVENINYLLRYLPLFEDFSSQLSERYLILDFLQSKNGPSDWSITRSDVYPHQ